MTVRLEQVGAAAWIRWSRPERLNAWDGETLAGLGAALAEAAASDARAIVLQGEGGAFSSGDDLRETAALTPEQWAATLAGFNRLTREVVGARQPVIAAVDGVCVGGACELAAACDIRVASPHSRFGCPEVAIGLSISNGFSVLAPRAARRLVLTGELVGAEEARRLGLVDLIAGDVEAEVGRLVERIASLAPLAVAGSKRLLDAASREELDRALDREAALCEQLFETADAREGLAAFLEKRAPGFRGA
ncbi:MAG TPA: enoyl-CoA hydratase-related protein [Gaiellaceae bacterium]|nr:enoyl-CoA hydratase-related protein [Gaiellaceae bacterium]